MMPKMAVSMADGRAGMGGAARPQRSFSQK